MPWVRAGACCSWEPGSSRIYSFVTCMGLGSRVAPLGWLLVDPGDPGIRRQLQECGAPGFFGRQSTGGGGGGEGHGLRGVIPRPLDQFLKPEDCALTLLQVFTWNWLPP